MQALVVTSSSHNSVNLLNRIVFLLVEYSRQKWLIELTHKSSQLVQELLPTFFHEIAEPKQDVHAL